MYSLLSKKTNIFNLDISKLIFAFFIFPFAGIFVHILFNNNLLFYPRAEYLQIFYLLFIIILKLKFIDISQNLLSLIKYLSLSTFVITSIELYYVLIQYKGIDGLRDIRAILYSPLYSSILIFFLSSFYISLLNKYEKINFFRFILNISLIFSLMFSLFLILLLTNTFKEPKFTNFTNSNALSYFFLFIFLIFYYFNYYLRVNFFLKYVYAISLILNFFVIFSHGSILILFIFIFLNFFNKKYLFKLIYSSMIIFLLIVVLGKIIQLLNLDTNYFLNFNEIILNYINTNETLISASSRLLTFYNGILNLFNNPNIFLFGIGEKSTLSFYYFGSSIHTFHVKFILSVGLLGFIAFCLMIYKFFEFNLKTFNQLNLIFLVLSILILLFENSIPFYFFLLFLLPKFPSSNTKRLITNDI